jgi:hypothetical protein
MVTLDLSVMDDTQLAMLAAVSPDLAAEVRSERRARSAFPDMASGFAALSAATLGLENGLAAYKKTVAGELVAKSDIINIAHRLMITAEKAGIGFDVAVLS